MALSIQDEREIASVILGYATGIDRRDWLLFRSCFTEDAIADYREDIRISTADDITSFIRELHRAAGETLHRVSNIDMAGSERGAAVRSYVDGLLTWPDGRFKYRTEGYYDDLLIRTDHGWKIKSRRFTPVRFEGELPETPNI